MNLPPILVYAEKNLITDKESFMGLLEFLSPRAVGIYPDYISYGCHIMYIDGLFVELCLTKDDEQTYYSIYVHGEYLTIEDLIHNNTKSARNI